MTKQPESEPMRAESTLAYMAAGVIGISLIALIASLALAFSGVRSEFVNFLVIFTQIGLPIGFLLIITLLFVSIRRRNREN